MVFLNWDRVNIAPQGTSGNVWRCFWLSRPAEAEGVVGVRALCYSVQWVEARNADIPHIEPVVLRLRNPACFLFLFALMYEI